MNPFSAREFVPMVQFSVTIILKPQRLILVTWFQVKMHEMLEFMLEVAMPSYMQIGNALPVAYEALWAEMTFGVNNSV